MRQLALEKAPASEANLQALNDWLCRNDHLHIIAAFAALPGEVDLTEIITRNPKLCWVWPRISGVNLYYHHVENPAVDLKPGSFGVREPSPKLPVISVGQIDAFLCPGLAFDARGGRLGRGRGFYDRMLAGARPDAMKIGVCFPWQIVADTFPETHDVMMDEVFSTLPPPDAQQ